MPPGMHPIVRFIVIFCLQHWVYFILFAVEMQGKITSLFSLASLLLLLSKHQQDYRHEALPDNFPAHFILQYPPLLGPSYSIIPLVFNLFIERLTVLSETSI